MMLKYVIYNNTYWPLFLMLIQVGQGPPKWNIWQ